MQPQASQLADKGSELLKDQMTHPKIQASAGGAVARPHQATLYPGECTSMGAAFLGNPTVKATGAAFHVLINGDYAHAHRVHIFSCPLSRIRRYHLHAHRNVMILLVN